MSILNTINDIFGFTKTPTALQGKNVQTNTVPIGGALTKIPQAIGIAKNVAVLGATALIGYGILKENPKAPLQLGSSLVSVGSDIGKFSSNPSFSSGVNILKSHPYISTVAFITGLGFSAKAVAPVVGGIISSSATRDLSQATREQTKAYSSQVGSALGTAPPETKGLPTTSEPMTSLPQNAQPQGSLPKKRKKSSYKSRSQTISQKVSVRVNTNSGNTKYIRNVLYN